MKKSSIWKVLIGAVVYLALFPLGSACGLIHPACYAYVGTFMPLLFGPVYLFVAANWRHFGAAAILNCVVLAVGLITGEADLTFIIAVLALTVLAEMIRKLCAYDTLKGIRLSFVPFAFSFYAYSGHWWTDTEASLAAALKEMPAGYADKMETVIRNIPMVIVMLALTIPVALLGMKIAEKLMKKQVSELR